MPSVTFLSSGNFKTEKADPSEKALAAVSSHGARASVEWEKAREMGSKTVINQKHFGDNVLTPTITHSWRQSAHGAMSLGPPPKFCLGL